MVEMGLCHKARDGQSLPSFSGLMVNFVIVLFLLPLATAVDFKSCILEVRNGTYGSVGGADNHGHPVSNISTATAISYDLCVHACGASAEPFVWTAFAQEVSGWLIPWMALVSQLPFGANDNLDNLASVLLAVGSPALAAYSLAFTVLNERWINQRFAAYSYPNIKSAVQILGSLQQAPLIITKTNALLASLVVLPDNDAWWSELVVWLDYTHTWSVSVVMSITWVVVAYLITFVDAFTPVTIKSSHSAIGCLWLWSLPIVIGWLQISPKCDSARLRRAIKRANEIAYVATPSGEPVLAESLTNQRAISLALFTNDAILSDVQCTAPIFNYSRFWSWTIAVEDVCIVFREASHRAHVHCSVNPDVDWETVNSHGPSPRNRLGTLEQVDAYCLPAREPTATRGSRRWAHGIWSRFLVASMVALSLQWGTTGGAIFIAWFSPTIGLGCESGSYLVYGMLSTIVWFLLVLSSFLSHYSATAQPSNCTSAWNARQLSIFLRRLGKVVAAINSLCIIVLSLFRFSGFFSRCYCLTLGERAFAVLLLSKADVSAMMHMSIIGAALAACSALSCVAFVNLFINPRFPE